MEERTNAEEQQTAAGSNGNIDMLMDIPLTVHVQVGQTRMPLREVLDLGPGSVLRLNRGESDGVELYINGRLVANGQIIQTPEGNIGVEVTSIMTKAERIRSLQ